LEILGGKIYLECKFKVEDYKSSDASTILSSITKTPNGSLFVVGNNGTILKKE